MKSKNRQSLVSSSLFSMTNSTGHQYTLDEVLRAYCRLVHLGYPSKGALEIVTSSYPEQADAVRRALA